MEANNKKKNKKEKTMCSKIDNDNIAVNCEVSVTLSKSMVIGTHLYCVEQDVKQRQDITELTATCDDIYDCCRKQHWSIPLLLGELANRIKAELASGGLTFQQKKELTEMLLDCEGWEETNFFVDSYGI